MSYKTTLDFHRKQKQLLNREMNILAIHNKYLQSGGEDICHTAEVNLLRERGHTVHEFVLNNQSIHSLGKLKTSAKTIWSSESYQKIKSLLKDTSYDFILVQNFFPLVSPSVFYGAEALGVPIFQFIHNFRLLCVNGLLFREGHICEHCVGKALPWPGIKHACYRGSVLGSSVVASMVFFHKMIRTWNSKVSQFIALTDFSRNKVIEGGIPAERISVRPSFISKDPGVGDSFRFDALFIGRLSPEKGLLTLINAWRKIQEENLTIIGSGPLFSSIGQFKQKNSINNIKLMGQLPHNLIFTHLKRSRFLVFPSLCYETFGRTIIESYATGTPVIAANLGAMSEIVIDGSTGLLFNPGDQNDLSEKVIWAFNHPKEMAKMGKVARAEYEAKYTSEMAYRKLMDIYSQVIYG